MTSPPRTIRSRSLHASIRDVSGASVAKALAGNTRSIVEGGKDFPNTISILRDKLILEYTLRVSQLQRDLEMLPQDASGYSSAVSISLKEASSDVFAATEAACESMKALNGKDLSTMKTYCNLVGMDHVYRAMRESLKSDVSIDLPRLPKIYLDYLSKGHGFNIDSESMKELAETVSFGLLEDTPPNENLSDNAATPPSSTAVRKSGAPHPINQKNANKKFKAAPKAPEPVPPPEPAMNRSPRVVVSAERSSSESRRSESPGGRLQQVSVSPVRSASPRQPSNLKQRTSRILREAMEAMKDAATLSQDSRPSSPAKISAADRDQKLADFANLVAYIHEPFDSATEEAIKQARQLKSILKVDLDEVERQMSAGEFFSQV